MANEKQKTYHFQKVKKEENDCLIERRRRMAEAFKEEVEDIETTRFGIALSGGGIRSAIINLGFLKTLNLYDVFRRADYLSTVSGGGYTGAYVQATMKNEGAYEGLFQDEHIKHMRLNGTYLIPGQTPISKFLNTLVLIIGYLGSLVMTLLSPVIVLSVFLIAYRLIDLVFLKSDLTYSPFEWYFDYVIKGGGLILLGVLGLHLLANLIWKFSLLASHIFNVLEGLIIGLAIVILIPVLVIYLTQDNLLENAPLIKNATPIQLLAILAGLIVLGFFLNPNALGFHRFYRHKLARSFLYKTGRFKNIKLKDLFSLDGPPSYWLAPYPLINTCLNLQNPGGGSEFKGTKASDYFLLSPKYCGAKLTEYVDTASFPGFNVMSLPAATTISAAALNPGMGNYSSRALSVIMTVLNLRLGYWVNNPRKKGAWFLSWWPSYFFRELFANMGANNLKINISDGGHIENLGVYELLRRKCRLILAVDGGADPKYIFSDLENLTVRARNELGVAISFREGNIPEQVLKVNPSKGYSDKRFAIADLYQVWEEFDLEEKIKVGTEEKKIKVMDDSTPIPKPVEVLVNYMPDGKLAPEVTLKGKLSEERIAKLTPIALKMVEDRLAKKEGEGIQKLKFGTMVYIKSSITAPMSKPAFKKSEPKKESKSLVQAATNYLKSFVIPVEDHRNYAYDTYKYKIYHPAFPHESTADQFFDPIQWESYFQLGQFIGAAVLGKQNVDFLKVKAKNVEPKKMTIADLIKEFDGAPPKEVVEAKQLVAKEDVKVQAMPKTDAEGDAVEGCYEI
jgi:hypothetical protein